ncbi:MAG: hypothetical protein ACKV0T_27065 [Planctomycetales bacterium]
MSATLSPTTPSPEPAARMPTNYVPAVGPKLKALLFLVFFLVALLGANSLYLVAITLMEWWTSQTYQNYFYQVMFLCHLALGLLLVAPFLTFGMIHLLTARNRRNRRAVRVGYALFLASIAVLVSGLALMRIGPFDLTQPAARSLVYWLHVGAPLGAGWLYWLHRLAGPRIKWRYGVWYLGTVGGGRGGNGGVALARSAPMARGRAQGRGRQVFPSVAGADEHGKFHSRGNAEDGYVLPRVS